MSGTGFPHQVIRASAGTGKTHHLALRFIGLLAAGTPPDQILATTFTRKAAGEILDRVLLRLAQAAADNQARKKLADEIGIQSLTKEKCRAILLSTVRQLHRLRVGTLDSYFIEAASSFGHELGLPPGWSICDELVDAALREEAIQRVLARGKPSDLLTLVHSLTKGAAARSVSQLVSEIVSSLLELHREAKPEAWEQIAISKGLTETEISKTISAVALFDLPEGQLRTTRDKDLAKTQLGDWESLIQSGFAAKILAGDYTFNRKPLPPELVSLYERLLKHAGSVLVDQVARQTKAAYELLTRFIEEYRALQLDERALRFGDITFRLADRVDALPAEWLEFRLDGGSKHLLLDEFQDTAPGQWRVIRAVARRATSKSGGSFFCVGDTKQAIYGWRGGVAEIFDALDSELTGLSCSELATSYRSAQPVIDTANAVFQNLSRHPNLDKFADAVKQWQDAFPLHSTARSELAGHVSLSTAPEAREGEDQTTVLLAHVADQVAAAAAHAPQASIGVLVRTNEAVARLIYLLRDRGIPASEEGGNPLIDSPAVELILSLLKLADHPGDSIARFHVAKSPLAKHVGELVNVTPSPNSDECGYDDVSAWKISQDLRRQLLEVGYGPTIYEWAKRLASSCDERDRSRLQQLIELAYEYQPASTLRTDDFLRLVQKKRIADPTSSDVRVMTIHQAKGLQFDIVFLPELSGQLVGQRDQFIAGRPGPTEPVNVVCRLVNEQVRQFFPPALQELFEDDTRREVAESLCVLYVAMTRAIHSLHMIIPPARANERSIPKSYAGLLRATLAADKPATGGKSLYEHGDVKWFRSLAPAPKAERLKPEKQQDATLAIRLGKAAPLHQRSLERKSPSMLEGGNRQPGARALVSRTSHSLVTGTLMHAWMEQISWLDEGVLSDQKLTDVAKALRGEIGDVSDELDDLIGAFREQMKAPAIAAVLRKAFYDSPENLQLPGQKQKQWPGKVDLTVCCERHFAIRDQAAIAVGSIDRLVLLNHEGVLLAADIVDFKTDELKPGDTAALVQRVTFYRPQLEAYRTAVAQMLRLDRGLVGARLVFTAAGAVESL
jgi:ATP-dependent exoDNAse (exonuclease V) beta subunit